MSVGIIIGIIAMYLIVLSVATVVLYMKVLRQVSDLDSTKVAIDSELLKVWSRLDAVNSSIDRAHNRLDAFDTIYEVTSQKVVKMEEDLVKACGIAEQAYDEAVKFHKAAEHVARLTKFPRLVRTGARLNG